MQLQYATIREIKEQKSKVISFLKNTYKGYELRIELQKLKTETEQRISEHKTEKKKFKILITKEKNKLKKTEKKIKLEIRELKKQLKKAEPKQTKKLLSKIENRTKKINKAKESFKFLKNKLIGKIPFNRNEIEIKGKQISEYKIIFGQDIKDIVADIMATPNKKFVIFYMKAYSNQTDREEFFSRSLYMRKPKSNITGGDIIDFYDAFLLEAISKLYLDATKITDCGIHVRY